MSRTRPGKRSQPREKSRFTVRTRAQQRPVLVGEDPRRIARGMQLTDGSTYFEVLDTHTRGATPWVLLANMDCPAAREWFTLEDAAPLGYVERKNYRASVASAEV